MKLAWIAPLLLGLLILSACSHPADEEQVRTAVKSAASAAEATDAGSFGDYLDKDFVGNDGDVEKRQLTGLLRLQRLRGERVSVLLGPIDVERRGQRLVATFTVTLGGGGKLLPKRLGVYHVESAWRHDSGE